MIPFMPDGVHLELRSAEEFTKVPWRELMAWCAKHARWGLVTRELVDWLREQIAGRTAIEVAAGQGDLGFHLGIPMSDSYVQQTEPAYKRRGDLVRQALTNPPPDVERLRAENAVAKYKPKVVIASWLTEGHYKGANLLYTNQFGADERVFIRSAETYILIGNIFIHGHKRIMATPHREYSFPWLWSRAADPTLNRIWVWDRRVRR